MMILSDKEFSETPLSVHGKILFYINDVEGFCDIVDLLPCVKK